MPIVVPNRIEIKQPIIVTTNGVGRNYLFIREVEERGAFETCLKAIIIFAILFGTTSSAEIPHFAFKGVLP